MEELAFAGAGGAPGVTATGLVDPSSTCIRERSRTALLVLGAAALLVAASCAPEKPSVHSDARTGAPSPKTDESAPGPAGSPTNELQARIIGALSELGIEATVAELSLDSAQTIAVLDDGSELIVNGVPVHADRSEYSVRDERRIAGVIVQRVEYPGRSDLGEKFQCGDVRYEAYGAVPPGFDSFDDFLAALIPWLGCS
jgi:hypothetical protein